MFSPSVETPLESIQTEANEIDLIEPTSQNILLNINDYEDGVASFLTGKDTTSFCRPVNPIFWQEFTEKIDNGFSFTSKDGKSRKKPGWNKIKKERLEKKDG